MGKLIEYKVNGDTYVVFGEYAGVDAEVFEPAELDYVLRNGSQMESFGETWAGVSRDESDVLGRAIAAYVNDDSSIEVVEVCDQIRDFKARIQSYSHEVDGWKVPDVVVNSLGDKAELIAISKTGAYYVNEESNVFIATRNDSSLATNYEAFFESALMEDFEKDQLLFMTDVLRENLQEMAKDGSYENQEPHNEQRESAWKHVIIGLNDMKQYRDSYEVQMLDYAIAWLENPKELSAVPADRFNEVYETLKQIKEEIRPAREKYKREFGYGDASVMQEYFPLDYAIDELVEKYRFYQTEILDIQYCDNAVEDFDVISYRQGSRKGYQLIENERVSQYMEEYDGADSKEMLTKLLAQEELDLTDLYILPYYSEISPAMLKFYDDIKDSEPGEKYYTDDDIRKCFGEDQSPKQIYDELMADIELYPHIGASLDIYTLGGGNFEVKFFDDFRTCIADSLDGERYQKMVPIRGDASGEEMFRQIEHALDIVAERDTQLIPNGGEVERTLKEALKDFENLSGQEVLISLKHEAEATGKRKNSVVLYGTMKYETQKDRQAAYKWVKKWLNKSAKELDHELSKLQAKNKGR